MLAVTAPKFRSGLAKLRLYGELVMFSHSLFNLPFGLVGMLLAANGLPSLRTFFWILVALVGARNSANALNRLIDRRYDAANPRTAKRHLPQGMVSVSEVLGLSITGLVLLVLGAWKLNTLCLMLSPVAVLILVGYSYTKRFTWASHLVLGLACSIAPTGAWLAVTGRFAFPPILLSGAVMCWVAGFDIIYATQDVEFDSRTGLHAIPARFGIRKALQFAGCLHLAALLLLLLVPQFLVPPHATHLFYYLGMLVVSGLLLWEHLLVNPHDLRKVTMASYYVNQVIGAVILLFTVLDIFIKI
jgi:4-hydroxybenzoate polyprenyltransferase